MNTMCLTRLIMRVEHTNEMNTMCLTRLIMRVEHTNEMNTMCLTRLIMRVEHTNEMNTMCLTRLFFGQQTTDNGFCGKTTRRVNNLSFMFQGVVDASLQNFSFRLLHHFQAAILSSDKHGKCLSVNRQVIEI